ncbi:MAG: hypothetical protein JWP22_3712, partial [Ramlibacter sp.]|nr:hypothetical protein [Ramlibacter sp.]
PPPPRFVAPVPPRSLPAEAPPRLVVPTPVQKLPPVLNGGPIDILRAALPQPARMHVAAPMLQPGRMPMVRAGGAPVPVILAQGETLVLQPLAHQLGTLAELDFGDGNVATMRLADGSVGSWQAAAGEEAT